MGDSTQRHLHDAFLNLLQTNFGMEELQVRSRTSMGSA